MLGSYKQGSDTLNSDVLANTKISNISEDVGKAIITFDGQAIPVNIATEQFVPMGPAASQVAIKQTGTNGGGFMGVNSAHPLENPNPFTNILEMLSILLIPAALCFTFGKSVKNKKQGVAIFMAMFVFLLILIVLIIGALSFFPALALGPIAEFFQSIV